MVKIPPGLRGIIPAKKLVWRRHVPPHQIRRELGDELDRAKRVWMKNALRTGEDSHMHGQWRELKVSISRCPRSAPNQPHRACHSLAATSHLDFYVVDPIILQKVFRCYLYSTVKVLRVLVFFLMPVSGIDVSLSFSKSGPRIRLNIYLKNVHARNMIEITCFGGKPFDPPLETICRRRPGVWWRE